jgi:hypothetical protein
MFNNRGPLCPICRTPPLISLSMHPVWLMILPLLTVATHSSWLTTVWQHCIFSYVTIHLSFPLHDESRINKLETGLPLLDEEWTKMCILSLFSWYNDANNVVAAYYYNHSNILIVLKVAQITHLNYSIKCVVNRMWDRGDRVLIALLWNRGFFFFRENFANLKCA